MIFFFFKNKCLTHSFKLSLTNGDQLMVEIPPFEHIEQKGLKLAGEKETDYPYFSSHAMD